MSELKAAAEGDEAPASAPKIGPGFAVHAAPEAIEHHLKQARRYEAAWRRRGDQLSQLLLKRNQEVAAGQWPPRRNTEQSATHDGEARDE